LETALAWPEQAFPLGEVSEWIAAVLALPAATVTPQTIYASYTDAPDLRLTARLTVTTDSDSRTEVVFKGCRFPLLWASARFHALVSRYAPGMTPQVLGWTESLAGDDCRVIYQPFEGTAVADHCDSRLLVQTAQTMALIQHRVAVTDPATDKALRVTTARHIPTLFSRVRTGIRERRQAWDADADGRLSRWLRFPGADVSAVLEALQPQVDACAVTVEALGLPLSINHGDLHAGNAIVQPDRTILISDWEIASLGCPLFSIERLLVDAWSLDTSSQECGPWGYEPGTPTQPLIRDAYLQASGLSHDDVPPTAFAAAMALATIHEMHREIRWAEMMQWADGNPEWTAQLISRLQHHLNDFHRRHTG